MKTSTPSGAPRHPKRGKETMKLKRIASLLLSAGLLLTMAVPAFAADTADITALTEQVSDQLITEHSTDTT